MHKRYKFMYQNMQWLLSLDYHVKILLFSHSFIRLKYYPINVLFQNKSHFKTLFY